MTEQQKPNHAQRVAAMTKRLQAEFPKAFKSGFSGWRALAVGIKAAIIERLAITDPEEISTLGAALAKHCNQAPYLAVMAKGLPRIDLEGKRAGSVSHDDRERAAQRLAAMVPSKPHKRPSNTTKGRPNRPNAIRPGIGPRPSITVKRSKIKDQKPKGGAGA